MERKIIESGKGTTEKFLSGVRKVNEMVGGTLGPAGRNRIIQRKYRSPLVTNDGVTIARHMLIENEVADLAAQTLVEIAMKTNETAGDGTTSSIVIASALIESCFEKIRNSGEELGGTQKNPMQMAREIRIELPRALELLKEQSITLEGDMLDDVISTSLEDLEYGKTLGELMREVGPDGYVATDDNWATKYGIDTELTKGMRFLGSYASPYLATEHNEREAIFENALVLVTNEKIDSADILKTLLEDMKKEKKFKLVIIGGHSENIAPFSKGFIRQIARAMAGAAKNPDGMIQVLAVKAPTLTSDELEDVATFCNALFFNKDLGHELKNAVVKNMGFAKKIVVSDDDVNIIDGAGIPEARIQVLKEQLDKEKDTMFKEKLKRRIASLSAGVGIIRVGAATEQERTYLKYKLEDAVHAAKAAMKEGIVPGGGLALKIVADALGEESVLYEALMAPYKRIRENAGGELDVPKNIVDPHKVVRLAFTNAISAAATLITCDGAIADQKLTVLDYFEKKLGKLNPAEDDFRDEVNQDRGNGRL